MSGRILIIDALATNRIVLKVKLSSAYYSVLQADSGRDALRQVRRDAPDLILTSATLPDMDASDFLAQLRGCEQTAGIPVVMILSDNAETTRVALLQAGANDVIDKFSDFGNSPRSPGPHLWYAIIKNSHSVLFRFASYPPIESRIINQDDRIHLVFCEIGVRLANQSKKRPKVFDGTSKEHDSQLSQIEQEFASCLLHFLASKPYRDQIRVELFQSAYQIRRMQIAAWLADRKENAHRWFAILAKVFP